MAGSTCILADADVVSYASPGDDRPAQGADTDTLTYELDLTAAFEKTVPYAWSRAGDQYGLLAFGNLIKLNGGEMPALGLRVKMGSCFRRCAVEPTATSPWGYTCSGNTGFLPVDGVNADIGVTQDASALCAASTDMQATESSESLAQPIQSSSTA